MYIKKILASIIVFLIVDLIIGIESWSAKRFPPLLVSDLNYQMTSLFITPRPIWYLVIIRIIKRIGSLWDQWFYMVHECPHHCPTRWWFSPVGQQWVYDYVYYEFPHGSSWPCTVLLAWLWVLAVSLRIQNTATSTTIHILYMYYTEKRYVKHEYKRTTHTILMLYMNCTNTVNISYSNPLTLANLTDRSPLFSSSFSHRYLLFLSSSSPSEEGILFNLRGKEGSLLFNLRFPEVN